MTQFTHRLIICLLATALSGCMLTLPAPAPSSAATQITTTPLADSACSGAFVTHELDHVTTTSSAVIGLYESNGAGVAINDLDNDGDLDIVLANLHDPNTILWNEGGLSFRTQRLAHGESRAVAIVDVDGDGWLDIVFTRLFAKPTLWRNTGADGDARFVEEALPDVNNPFYTMDWADLDKDGDLDLAIASYDTELRKHEGPIFDYQGGGVGVFVYARTDQGYVAERLSDEADALALALVDLNADAALDILVGNDFIRPDYAWLHTTDGWRAADLFGAMTENTMSFDVGDVDNNGSQEIFATDMKPYAQDAQTEAAWMPLMEMMSHPASSDDPQHTDNVLQVLGADGRYQNEGLARQVDATGWSWSSRFGDLDNDGFLDIYVVNGMIADGLLAHLPNDELVEENRALRNDGHGDFTLADAWGLGSTASGRGMSMADLDSDGDLDIVVNNLRSPAQLFENQLCGGAGLAIDLRWPASPNPFAIGAQLTLHTSMGAQSRTIRAASGYLSGNATRVHFGAPADATLEKMEIRWPDGAISTVDAPELHTLIQIERTN
ncbi:MAG: CRTAC1 family protein [Caldilineaceae bacterium]